MKTRLIAPKEVANQKSGTVNWEGCDYSKCGRTDKGVSAFGQVIGIRVMSKMPPQQVNADGVIDDEDDNGKNARTTTSEGVDGELHGSNASRLQPIHDEFPYVRMLNQVLPEDIRILAWCPAPPKNFSARFDCRERRYRYFFTQPAFLPLSDAGTSYETVDGTTIREGWLDIKAMQEAAKHFVGLHDFRNFCKVDETKQISNFQRRIFHAEIDALDDRTFGAFRSVATSPGNPSGSLINEEPSLISSELSRPTVYSFTVHGTAFLWHQVRHLVAIIFLVGQGLENPSIVKDLLDVSKTPSKPLYEMATDAPLVLWDCIFPADGSDSNQDSLEWVYPQDGLGYPQGSPQDGISNGGKNQRLELLGDIWSIWRRRKIDELLAGALLGIVGKGAKKLELCSIAPENTKWNR